MQHKTLYKLPAVSVQARPLNRQQVHTFAASLLGCVRCLADRLVPLLLGGSAFLDFLRLTMGSSSESSSSSLSSTAGSGFFLFLAGCSACSAIK